MDALDLTTLIGVILDDKYQLETLLGQGGMGAVFRATHLGIKRPVAVKVIAPRFMTNQEIGERFRREAEAAGRLLHPNVVNVTDYGIATFESQRIAYLVMEYLDGRSLGSLVKEAGSLDLPLAVDIVQQVCQGVGHAHRQGVIHRDLKPDNIWLQPDGLGGFLVKVLDFGLAKLRGPLPRAEAGNGDRDHADSKPAEASGTSVAAGVLADLLSTSPVDPEATMALPETDRRAAGTRADDPGGDPDITRVGSVLGTPVYMSPEQCAGQPLDARSDIYSLAVITHHVLAGQPPFGGDTTALISQHLTATPPSLRIVRPDVSTSLAELVSAAMAKDPSRRPRTPEAFAALLRLNAEGTGPLRKQATANYQTMVSCYIAATAIAMLPPALVAMSGYALMSSLMYDKQLVVHFIYNLAALPLFVLGTTVGSANCALVAQLNGNVSRTSGCQWRLLRQTMKRQPSFWAMSIMSLAVGLSGHVRRGGHGSRMGVDTVLLPAVIAVERLGSRAAMERARSLVILVRSIAVELRIRELGLVFFCAAYGMLMWTIMPIMGASHEDVRLLLTENRYIWVVLYLLGWFMAATTQAHLIGLPFVELYRRSLLAAGEAAPSLPSSDGRLGSKRRSRIGFSRVALAWLIIPLTWYMLGIGVIVRTKLVSSDIGESVIVAVRNNHQSAVLRLLSMKSDPNAGRLDGMPPITLAAADDRIEIVRALLAAGADVRATDDDGKTALDYAAEKGHLEVVQALLAAGAPAGAGAPGADTPLMIAARSGRTGVVAALLAAGVDPTTVNRDGKTALDYALANDDAEIVRLLRAEKLP